MLLSLSLSCFCAFVVAFLVLAVACRPAFVVTCPPVVAAAVLVVRRSGLRVARGRCVCDYVIVRLVLRLQSFWRGLRVRRAVAAHIHVLHFLGVSRYRFDRCDAFTNDLIQSFVGALLVQVTHSRDVS